MSEFAKNKRAKDGYQHSCRACNKSWRSEYYEKYPERNRKRSIKNNHGMTWEHLEELYEKQGASCAICGKHIGLYTKKGGDPLQVGRVDHCHSSGKIRGLLCHKCNIGLGHFEDNVVALRNAIDYLEEHKDVD